MFLRRKVTSVTTEPQKVPSIAVAIDHAQKAIKELEDAANHHSIAAANAGHRRKTEIERHAAVIADLASIEAKNSALVEKADALREILASALSE